MRTTLEPPRGPRRPDIVDTGKATYPALDRFNRVIDLLWTYYAPSPDQDAVRIQHGYDADSNRLCRKNLGETANLGNYPGPLKRAGLYFG